jgi:hypothetical protein
MNEAESSNSDLSCGASLLSLLYFDLVYYLLDIRGFGCDLLSFVPLLDGIHCAFQCKCAVLSPILDALLV